MQEMFGRSAGRLIRLLGEPTFPKALLESLKDVINADHLAIVAFDNRFAGHPVAAESMDRKAIAKAAGRVYESSVHYRNDPSLRMISERRQPAKKPLIFRLRARDIENTLYRKQIYEDFGLVDRITLIDQFASQWYATSFYRGLASGFFGRGEVAKLEAIAELVVALVGKHFSLAPQPEWHKEGKPSVQHLEHLVRHLDANLTARQIQVCARALVGMTNSAIGLDLGIRAPTVATLRKRAYAVLNISSLNELFALCLAEPPLHGGEEAA